MSEIINLNNTVPAVSAGAQNVLWQKGSQTGTDPASGYGIFPVSAYVLDMVGDSGSGGTDGLVPAPPSGSAAASKFLKADGTWEVPGGTSTPPGGSSSDLQYNNAGAFGGITGATSDGTNLMVTTQSPGDNTTKAASTAFVTAAVGGGSTNTYTSSIAGGTQADSSGFTAMKGIIIQCAVSLKVKMIFAMLWETATATPAVEYQLMIYQITSGGSPTISAIVYTGSLHTPSPAGSPFQILDNLGSAPVSLTSGDTYAVVLQAPNQSGTFALPIAEFSTSGLWRCAGFQSSVGSNIGNIVENAAVNPSVGASLTIATASSVYDIQLGVSF